MSAPDRAPMGAAPLEISIVSDVVCPWCFVGQQQLQQALAQWAASHPGGDAPVLRWYPFQLNPDLPAAGVPRREYMAAKFAGRNLDEIHRRLEAAAASVGLTLALDRIATQPNTLKAHALIDLAADAGLQTEMAHALFAAYFQQGRDLADDAQLREVAQAVGLNDELIGGALDEPAVAQRVAAVDADLRRQGVGGVPLFIFGRGGESKAAVEGAQGAAALLQAMAQAAQP